MPNDRPRLSPGAERRPAPRRSFAARLALLTWGALFLLVVASLLVPSMRYRMLIRIWAFQGWSQESPARGWLKNGGAVSADVLMPYLKPEGGMVRDLFLEMGGTALDRFWKELADHESSREFFIGLIAKNSSPDSRSSVTNRLQDANPVVRRAAVEISLVHFGQADRAWTSDPDLVVRAMALPYFLEPAILDSAMKVGGEMAREVLHLALRMADKREERMLQLRRHELMPGASPNDPLWAARHEEITRAIQITQSKCLTLDACIERHLEGLMRSAEPLPPQVYTWLEFHGPQERYVPLLREALLHKDADHRRAAALCLGAWKDEASATALWAMTQEDADEVVRISAWEALKMMSPVSLLPDLRTFLAKPDAPDILDALELMGHIGSIDDIPLLQTYVQGYDHDAAQVARGACVVITERSGSGR
ncbi:MAG: HEAT repeat domain-containing protein [Planctomycetota bacterium]